MRNLILLLIASSLVSAQTFTGVSVQTGYGSLHMFYTVDTATTVCVGYGTTTTLAQFSCRSVTSGPVEHFALAGLTENTKYYFNFYVGGTVKWNCNTNAPVSGAGCDAGSGHGYAFTDAKTSLNATISEVLRPDVSMLMTIPPTPTLPDLSVTPSSSSSLQSQINACASTTTTGQVRRVKVPPGIYTGNHNLPPVNGTGWCILTGDPSAVPIPPDGVRITPQWEPGLPIIETSYDYTGQCCDESSSALYGNSTRGWYIMGIEVRQKPSTTHTPTEYTVNTVSNDGLTFTLSPAPGPDISTHRIVQVFGVNGTWVDAPNGVHVVGGTSGSTITLNTWGRSTGGWTSGGKVRTSVASLVADASNTSPIIVTTSRPHGISERGLVPISQISSGVMTVSSDHGISQYVNVLVQGSSISAWNGIWPVSATTATSVTIGGTFPATPCSSSCGTVQFLNPLTVQGVQGNTAANGVWQYQVVNSTQLRLLGSTGNGAYTSGGIVAQDPAHNFNLVAFDRYSTDIYLDRVYFKGGFPSRVATAAMFPVTNGAVINSYFDDIQFHFLTRPGYDQYLSLYQTNNGNIKYIATVSAIDITYGQNKLISNNYIRAHGISVYIQDPDPANGYLPSNIVVSRNTMTKDPAKRFSAPGNDGLYYPSRHLFELKRGQKILFAGNEVANNWIDWNSCGPAITFTPVTLGNSVRDVTIENNAIHGITEGMQILGVSVGSADRVPLIRRIRISNNLFYDIDGSRAVPFSIVAANGPNPGYCGRALRLNMGGESIFFDHNTVEMPKGGSSLQWIEVKNALYSGLRIQNNIGYYAGGDSAYNSVQPVQVGMHTNWFDQSPDIPGTAIDEKTSFNFWAGPYSVLSHNYIVPSIGTGGWDSTGTGYFNRQNWDYNDCAVSASQYNRDLFANFKGMHCVGSPLGGDSPRQRYSSVKWIDTSNVNYRLRHDSPLLASKDRSVTITSVASGVMLVPAGHQLHAGYAVKVTGSSTTALNGSQTVSSINADGVHVTLSGMSGISCTSSCGTLTSPDLAPTSDGKDPGAEIDSIENAQGKVRNARVPAVGSTTVTVAYTAPDTAACTLEYGTSSAWGTGTRVSDGGGVPYRAVSLSGLSSGTTYYYRVLCAAEQPSGSFTTR